MSSVRHSMRFPAFHTTNRSPWSFASFSHGLRAITGQGRTRVYLRGQLRRTQPAEMLGTLRSWLEALLMLSASLVGAVACVTTVWLLTLYAGSVSRKVMRQRARG